MNNLSQEEEIKKLKILNDIYMNENERLKYEYRVLYDKYKELLNSTSLKNKMHE